MTTEKRIRLRIVNVLTQTCGTATIAEILNSLLGAEADPNLSDIESKEAERLFDLLSDANPQAVDAAQGR